MSILFPFMALGMALASEEPYEHQARTRARRYLESISPKAGGAYGAVARLAAGGKADLAGLGGDLAHVNSRLDCSDFIVAGLLRLLYLYRDDPRLSPDARDRAIATLMDFKYWIDEPGHDSMCYWSENHQVLYHSAEYLAGNLLPDRVFSNSGMTGREHAAKGRRLLEGWFCWRERFGFSEWLSNVYYDEDLAPLLNLYDFAPDPEIRVRAAMAVDQLALNMALNSYRGVFACTHGRSYGQDNRTAAGDNVKQAMYVWWGLRPFTADMASASMSGVALATSSYRLPPALYHLGSDDRDTFENYQTHGIAIESAPSFGIGYDEIGNGMFFWGMGMYTHPLVADLSARMWQEYDLSSNSFFLGLPRLGAWASRRGILDDLFAKNRIATEGAYLDDANTYSFRTPHYILSCVLDRRPGRMGAQNVCWQAGLGGDAIVFTTYPGAVAGKSPDKWTGNASNPRAAQKRNVLIAIYNPSPRLYLGEYRRYGYTHAWFPSSTFDEVRRQGHWTFGRKGGGYIGLYSARGVGWAGPDRDELIAPGIRNVWVCELGSAESHGSFERFVAVVSVARVEVAADSLNTLYRSPSLGAVEFGWTGPFKVAGAEVPLRRDFRYDNPYVRAARFGSSIEVNAGGSRLSLDFERGERVVE